MHALLTTSISIEINCFDVNPAADFKGLRVISTSPKLSCLHLLLIAESLTRWELLGGVFCESKCVFLTF